MPTPESEEIERIFNNLREDVEGYSIPGNDEAGIDAMFTKAKAEARASLTKLVDRARLEEREQVRVYNELTSLGRLENDNRIAELEQRIAAGEEEG